MEDFRQLGDIFADILADVAKVAECRRNVVIDLAEYRAGRCLDRGVHVRPPRNNIASGEPSPGASDPAAEISLARIRHFSARSSLPNSQ